jgi:hypothetical protein
VTDWDAVPSRAASVSVAAAASSPSLASPKSSTLTRPVQRPETRRWRRPRRELDKIRRAARERLAERFGLLGPYWESTDAKAGLVDGDDHASIELSANDGEVCQEKSRLPIGTTWRTPAEQHH